MGKKSKEKSETPDANKSNKEARDQNKEAIKLKLKETRIAQEPLMEEGIKECEKELNRVELDIIKYINDADRQTELMLQKVNLLQKLGRL